VTGVQQLDGDRSRQHGISGPPYLAEPVGADLLIKQVTTIEERPCNGH
jgi:hypothetical protein